MSKPSVLIHTDIGTEFDLYSPDITKLNIDDAATALSNTCRFGRHCRPFYSVAQHCVIGSQLAPKGKQKKFFLHEGGEVWFGDLPTPLKYSPDMAHYKMAEHYMTRHYYRAFGLDDSADPELKEIDDRLCITEALQLFKVPPPWTKSWHVTPYDKLSIFPLQPEAARAAFLRRWEEVQDETNE